MRYVIVSFFSFFILACSSDDSNSYELGEPDFFGLKIGNTWEYHYYKRQGTLENYTYIFDGAKSTNEVKGIVEIDDEEFFEIEISMEGNCGGCPPDGVSHTYLRVVDNKLKNDSGHILLFVGESIGQEKISSSSLYGDIIITYSGESSFESEYGDFPNVHNNNMIIVVGDTQGLGLDSIKFVEGIGMVFRTISGASSPFPFAKQYLVNFTSN